jgi:hypothetical protein
VQQRAEQDGRCHAPGEDHGRALWVAVAQLPVHGAVLQDLRAAAIASRRA